MKKKHAKLLFYSAILFIIFLQKSIFAQDALNTIPPETRITAPAPETKAPEPFSFADFTWLNGNSRQKNPVFDSAYFTGEFSFDSNYVYDFIRPSDHTLIGSGNSGRTGEIQVQQLGVGGDFHFQNIRGRIFTQFGMYSSMTPRSDPSTGRGQWGLADAYRYLSEAYAGYHWDVWNGINLDVGLFMSYIGLCSYYNYENWIYQMSYISANTPWFFNGIRLQVFPNDRLKSEIWITNGWQSYGSFNEAPGIGFQLLWRPTGSLSLVSNYYFGKDTLGNSARSRLHTDHSVQYKYLDQPANLISKAAFSVTLDAGCESGGGVSCSADAAGPAQYILGVMAYNRFWISKDRFAITVGAGAITNPGRYLVILPPINGATAFNGTPYFTTNPGDPFKAWDSSFTFDYMPSENLTFRIEFIHREANVPFFAGSNGITPPGGNQGNSGSFVSGWQPDLAKSENRINSALLIRL